MPVHLYKELYWKLGPQKERVYTWRDISDFNELCYFERFLKSRCHKWSSSSRIPKNTLLDLYAPGKSTITDFFKLYHVVSGRIMIPLTHVSKQREVLCLHSLRIEEDKTDRWTTIFLAITLTAVSLVFSWKSFATIDIQIFWPFVFEHLSSASIKCFPHQSALEADMGSTLYIVCYFQKITFKNYSSWAGDVTKILGMIMRWIFVGLEWGNMNYKNL